MMIPFASKIRLISSDGTRVNRIHDLEASRSFLTKCIEDEAIRGKSDVLVKIVSEEDVVKGEQGIRWSVLSEIKTELNLLGYRAHDRYDHTGNVSHLIIIWKYAGE